MKAHAAAAGVTDPFGRSEGKSLVIEKHSF